jgi:hypothetical protein
MRSENSGLIDLDALLKEASQPELPKSADDSLEVTAPPPEPPPPAAIEAKPAPAPPRPISPPEDSLRAISAAPRVKSAPSRKGWLLLVPATLVVAFVVGFRQNAAVAPAATVAATTTTTSPAPVAIATGISLGDLPAAVASSSAARAAATTPTTAHVAHAPSVVSSASVKLTEVADAPQSATGDLGGAMREAVGPRASAEIAVADETAGRGARQLRPSPGAVVGAINSVMPAARLCLSGGEIVRNATIVFASDGTVSRVDIAGPPNVADDCIRGALTNARTTPFVADTFAARATVRP